MQFRKLLSTLRLRVVLTSTEISPEYGNTQVRYLLQTMKLGFLEVKDSVENFWIQWSSKILKIFILLCLTPKFQFPNISSHIWIINLKFYLFVQTYNYIQFVVRIRHWYCFLLLSYFIPLSITILYFVSIAIPSRLFLLCL